jgi:N-acyl-D-amino-acid deacylase
MHRAHTIGPTNITFDFVIEGGTMLDGSGAPAINTAVGVIGDRIAAVGNLAGAKAHHRIDASGLTLAPGFIDCHSHDDCAVLDTPDMLPKISQGVTTVVNGNCGLSLAPLAAARAANLSKPLPAPLSLFAEQAFLYPSMATYRDAIDAAAISVNVAQLIGHGTMRAAFVHDIAQPATTRELAQMCEAIEEALDTGCLGMSAGLAYRSSSAAPTAEIVTLARTVAACNGILTIHLRDEGAAIVGSVAEAIHIAREAKVATVLSHHKCVGKNAWGLTKQTLAEITAARADNADLALELDCYPYTASSTVLMKERAASATRTVLTYSASFPQMAGRDLSDIARDWGTSIDEAIARLSPAGAVYFNMDEDDLLRVLKFPGTMIGSDGLSAPPQANTANARPHPRLWGTFPRVLGHYVRERGALTLADAVHRMTGVPARVFSLKDRGAISVGAFADLVLFDAKTVIDRATFESPTEMATGIACVWVNGKAVWSGNAPHRDTLDSKRPGRWLTRSENN